MFLLVFFWHVSTVNAAFLLCIACIFIFCWRSPGTVTCVLLCLHVCHASTVTAAFRDPIFFSGLAAYANGARYVIGCFFLAR